MVGSLRNLYESFENIQPGQTSKDALLQPSTKKLVYRCNTYNCYTYSDNENAVCPRCHFYMNQRLTYVNVTSHQLTPFTSSSNYLGASSSQQLISKCGYCGWLNNVFRDNEFSICVNCNRQMSTATMKGSSSEGGFVKGVVGYMVMYDLVVKPMSTVSTLTFLNKFDVKEVGVLTEKEVKLSMNEAAKLLKTSLHSKTVLTDVFLIKEESF